MDKSQNIDFVLRTVEERDIRFVRLWFVDVLGRLKSFAISPEDLEVAFEEGIGFDGSAIEGFTAPEEADMLAFPDPSTFQVLPWRPSSDGVARIFCDVCTPDRKPFAGDPRNCLRRMFRQAEEAGYIMNVGTELEFYYFPDEHNAQAARHRGLLRPAAVRLGARRAPQHGAHAREDERAGGVHLPFVRSLAARHLAAPRRGAHHVRRNHDG